MLLATHSLHFRVHTRVLATLAFVLLVLLVTALGAPAHRRLLAEASAAKEAGDQATFLAKLEAARDLRPDYPRVLLLLARGYASAGRAAEALEQLRVLADMGLAFDIANDPALTALRPRPDFAELAARFAANASPATVARDEAAWAVTDVTGIIESVAIHPQTLESFFGDVRNRCIWYRDVSGPYAVLRKFSAEADALDAVFAVKVDAARGTLWASCAALPEMQGYTAADHGRAYLAAYDLRTRRLRAKYPVVNDGAQHVLGDFAVAPDGAVYVTDSTSPVIWRWRPGRESLERWLGHDDFVSLQGIALAADATALHVADYANGIWRVDIATATPTLLPPPARATLFGIDGLYPVPGGLIAIQNGISPQRVLRLELDPHGQPVRARVLTAGHATMTDVALGEVINGRLHFVANAGWSLFEKPDAPAPAPRTVTILSTSTE